MREMRNTILTAELMLNHRIERFEERYEQGEVRFVGEEEGWRRHRCVEAEELGTGSATKIFQVRGDVVDDGEQSRINNFELSFAAG